MAGSGGAAPGCDSVWCRGAATVLCRRRGPVAGIDHDVAARSAFFERGNTFAGKPRAAAQSCSGAPLRVLRGAGPDARPEMVGALVGLHETAGPRARTCRARRPGSARM